MAKVSQIFLPDEETLEKLILTIAPFLSQFHIIYLEGDLGTGKTTLTRYFLKAMGYQGHVKSPTYTIMESYEFEVNTNIKADLTRTTSKNLDSNESDPSLEKTQQLNDSTRQKQNQDVLYKVAHMDLYRFESAEEWYHAGLDDELDKHNTLLIEWPKMAEGYIPPQQITIQLEHQNEGRQFRLIDGVIQDPQLNEYAQQLHALGVWDQ